jgi:hypothetical protein
LDRDIKRRYKNVYIDVLKSDVDAPNYYEWHFSLEYPAFPPRAISNWTVNQIKECNNALESGALYVVDIKGQNPTKHKHQKQTRSAPAPPSNENERHQSLFNTADHQKEFIEATVELSNAEDLEKDHIHDRRQLVSKTEAAFTHYIGE